MQTFLPYPNFAESAAVLDSKRLGKQRVEVLQIVNALDKSQDKGWKNHPATKMWEGYPVALINYGLEICIEWRRRGFKDTCFDKLHDRHAHGLFVHTLGDNGHSIVASGVEDPIMPGWLGREDFHRSHQSNLIRKDPEYYGPKFPGVPSHLGYVWPI